MHALPTFDIVAGVVRGWDVFKDNNDMVSFHGGFVWNSPDKRYNWTTAWITGPEQPDNDHDYRTLVTSYLTAKFGSGSEWILSAGGHFGYEAMAALSNAMQEPANGHIPIHSRKFQPELVSRRSATLIGAAELTVATD